MRPILLACLLPLLAAGCAPLPVNDRYRASLVSDSLRAAQARPDLRTLDRDLERLRTQQASTRATVGVAGLGLIVAGLFGLDATKGTPVGNKGPWIALTATGGIVVVAAIAGTGQPEPAP